MEALQIREGLEDAKSLRREGPHSLLACIGNTPLHKDPTYDQAPERSSESSPFGWGEMKMKIIGCLLVIGILFSYVPVFPMNECPEGNHTWGMKMDCGSLFHCPMIVDNVFSESSALPFRGCLVPTKLSLAVEAFPDPIYHPPKYSIPNSYLREKEQLDRGAWGFGTRIAVKTTQVYKLTLV